MSSTHSRWAAPLAVVLLALVAASLFAYPRQWTRGFLLNEEFYFATLARNVADGDGYVTYAIDPFVADEVEGFPVAELTRPPGYAVVYAAVLALGIDPVIGGTLLSMFWLGVAVFAFFWVAETLLSSKAALFLCGIYLASFTALVHGTAKGVGPARASTGRPG